MNRDPKQNFLLLEELDISPVECTLFSVINYGPKWPNQFLHWAEGDAYSPSGTSNTLEQCKIAFEACLAKGWLKIADAAFIQRIQKDLLERQILGPIYGLPVVGTVDFTSLGASLWLEYLRRSNPNTDERQKLYPHTALAYPRTTYDKTAYFFPSLKAAHKEMERLRVEDADVTEIEGPVAIGPFRLQWWRRFEQGYRIDVLRKYFPEDGLCSSESSYLLYHSERWRNKPDLLMKILDGYGVTYPEWLILSRAEYNVPTSQDQLSKELEYCQSVFGIKAEQDEYLTGLQACLEKGWLRTIDESYFIEIDSLLKSDPILLPVKPDAEKSLKDLDFSPAGAALYRSISAEFVGPDWEEDLRIEKLLSCKLNYYCETREGIEAAYQKLLDLDVELVQSSIVRIATWCVHWWESFPNGYLMNVEVNYPDCDFDMPEK